MSRGLGIWQRRLLDAVSEHEPKTVHGYPVGLHTAGWLRRYLGRRPTEAERQAVYRAARTLTARGLIRQDRFYLFKAGDPQSPSAGWVVRIYEEGGAYTLYRDGASWATRDEARAAVRAELGRLPHTHKAVAL